jgi:hypothetical protein
MGQIGAIERRMFADAIHHGLHNVLVECPRRCSLPLKTPVSERGFNHVAPWSAVTQITV